MKEFNLEEAKAGKPVCTRDGKKARIICFDAKGDYPIGALIEESDKEYVYTYTKNGECCSGVSYMCLNLMMATEKHECWLNIYRDENSSVVFTGGTIYDSENDARNGICDTKDIRTNYVTTIKIEWEE